MSPTPAAVPTKKKLPWWAILLIVFGSLVLLGALGIGGIAWWLASNKDRLLEEGKKALEEGETFATSHDQNACLEEGLRKVSACVGVMCETRGGLFTKACAQQAKRTAGFCDGVPPRGELLRTAAWSVEECQRRGRGQDQRCARLFQRLSEICHDPKAH